MGLQKESLGPHGPRGPNDCPAELVDVTRLASTETAAAVLMTEDEDVLTNMASLALEVDESGENCIRGICMVR